MTTYSIYANTGAGDPIAYNTAVNTTTTTTWTSSALSYPGTWSFGVRASNAYGEEQNLDCAVTVFLSASGADITRMPPAPTDLKAYAVAGGGIRVEWHYAFPPASRRPSGFHIYQGGHGFIRLLESGYRRLLETHITTVAYTGLTHYAVTIPGLADGTSYSFTVRAYNAVAEEPNTVTVTATADATGPTAIDGLTITATAAEPS